jgi:hypothetical protein
MAEHSKRPEETTDLPELLSGDDYTVRSYLKEAV